MVASFIFTQTGHGGLARYASTSVVATKSSPGGFFGWLTGEKSSSLPLIDFLLEDLVLPASLRDYVELRKTKITTLTNGLKIASEVSAGCFLCNFIGYCEG